MLATPSALTPSLLEQVIQVTGRVASPSEQAWPMIFLNSDAASHITGENIFTDDGSISSMTTRRLKIQVDSALFDH